MGRKAWKQETSYHRRALAETAMARTKAIIGPGLKARTFDRQQVEAALAVRCINRFTSLGMPVSVLEVTHKLGPEGERYPYLGLTRRNLP